MSNTYWKKRIREENRRDYKRTIEETNHELRALYKKQSEKLYGELIRVFAKMEADSKAGKFFINDLYRTKNIFRLIAYFNSCAKTIGGKQVKVTEKALITAYKRAKKIVEENVPKEAISSSFLIPSEIDPKQVVHQTWCIDGKNFSERIWQNKELLVQDLAATLSDYVMRGATPYQIAQGVAERLAVDESSAYRIIRTETAHTMIDGQITKYKEMGFTKGRYVASDACGDCGVLNGRIFSLEELRSMIPQHPNCTCSFELITD